MLQLEKNWELAKSILEREKNKANDIDILLELGKIYSSEGNYKNAIDNFKLVLKIDENNERANANIITAYQECGDYMKAEKFFEGIKTSLKDSNLLGKAYLVLKKGFRRSTDVLRCISEPERENHWLIDVPVGRLSIQMLHLRLQNQDTQYTLINYTLFTNTVSS